MRSLISCVCAIVVALGSVSLAHAAAGRTPGSFNVSQTGAATYSIPIWVPPGPRGIQPSLALVYNSQAGDGMMGPGWNLVGLGAITRCNKTYKEDTTPAPVALVTTDGYCVNGNRLRLTSGTYGTAGSTYQTEIADFSLITANGTVGNGPSSFTVKGKNGSTYEYGNTTSSRILYGTTAGQWLLNKVSDRAGNNYIVTYGTGAAGSAAIGVPLSISYTPATSGSGTYNYSVAFAYGTKVSQVPSTNDPAIVGYVNGVQVVNTNLLLTISVSSSSSGSSVLVRKYTLAYGAAPTTTRARLTSVTECGGSAGTDCLPATTVAYQDGSAGVASTATTVASGSYIFAQARDLTGDGHEDIVLGAGSTVYAAISSGSGYLSPITVATGYSALVNMIAAGDLQAKGKYDLLIPISGVFWRYTWNGSSFTGTTTGISVPANAYRAALIDINGDGLPDLVVLTKVTTTVGTTRTVTVTALTRLNNSTASTLSFSSTLTTAYTGSQPCKTSEPLTVCNLDLYTGAEPRSGVHELDFDGDGRKDIVRVSLTNPGGGGASDTATYLISNGSVFTAGSSVSEDTPVVGYANWNNDGCTDVVTQTVIAISPCNSASASLISTPATVLATLDWDGDGRTDILVQNGTTFGVYESTGTGSSSLITTTIPVSTTNAANTFIVDQGGDGEQALGTWSTTSTLVYAHNGAGSPPDLLSGITDGLGMVANPTYVSIARNNYTLRTDGTISDKDYIGPVYVVSQFSASDGTGGTYTNSFAYTGAHMNLQGLGFDGFYSMRTQDSRNSAYRYRYFERDFPKRGMVFEDDRYQPDGTTFMSSLNVTNATATLDSTTNNQRYFPNASSSLEKAYEVGGAKNGTQITSTSTTYTYDNPTGNVTNLVVAITDTDAASPASPYNGQVWTTTVANTITPDTGNWCLNLPTQTTVTKSSTTAPAITRTVGFTPDYVNCRMNQQVVEPGSATYKVTEDLLYDAFGNVNSDKITGLNMTARTTLTDWGTTGQFSKTITNPLSQATSFGYNFDLGVRSSVTDPNSIQMSWQFDNFVRQTQVTNPDGTYTTTDYNACAVANNWCGTSSSSTDLRIESYIKNYGVGAGLINQQYVSTDGYGRTRYKKHVDLAGTWTIEQTIYDALGRVHQQSVPYQSTAYFSTFTYDLANRVTLAQRPISSGNSTLQTTTYAYLGRTTTATDPQSKVTTKISQVTGAMGRTQDHNGYYVDFAYDAFGSVLTAKDSSAPVNTLFSATYDYGLSVLQRTTSDIDRGNWSYSYDALGELKNYTDAKSQNFSYSTSDSNSPYDLLGRPVTRTEPDLTTTWTWGSSAASHNIGKLQSVSAVGTATYSEANAFDSTGRLTNRTITPGSIGAQAIDVTYSAVTGLLDTLTYPTSTSSYRLKLQYGYANGFLQSVKDYNTPTTVFWTANTVNAFGEVTKETLGNGVVTNRAYDAVTGWMSSNQAGVGGGTTLLNQSYLYDLVGNVTQRQDNNRALTESVCYDNVYRLDHTTATGVCTGATSLQMSFDAMGNITSRSDVNAGAAWTYDSVHKHQVKTAGSGNSYAYDLNGNMNSRNGNAITWTSYNYPLTINGSGESTTFNNGADHQYWQQSYTGSSGTETTYYVDKLLERVDTSAGSEYRHYIFANGARVAIYSRTSSGTNTLRYSLEDHQGTFSSILTSAGGNYVSESFAPFGGRRDPTSWSGSPSGSDLTLINGVTRVGYTGQTMLGNMGLIHMNGRVEDSVTGRFLSTDPYVTQPENVQNFNRYGYVYNNPLTFIDPSGFDTTEHTTDLPDYTTKEECDHIPGGNWDNGRCTITEVIATPDGHGSGPDIPILPPDLAWTFPGDSSSLALLTLLITPPLAPNKPLVLASTLQPPQGNCGPPSLLPHAAGLAVGGTVEAGSPGDSGVAATGSAGGGVFVDANGSVTAGAYASGGAAAYSGNAVVGAPAQNSPTVMGGSAGGGASIFVTNAQSVQQLRGPFKTYSLNVGVGPEKWSFQLALSGGIWQLSVGPPATGATEGLSVSRITTNTVTTATGCH